MSLQETLESIRSSPAPPNEEAAKFKIIAPILRSLGWDMSGPQVLLEHSVGDKRTGGRVDIALRERRGVVALIEAKAPKADLSTHVGQVLGYAFHEGVDICALTTGTEWWLYLPREGGQPEERRFAVLDVHKTSVDDLAADFESFLSRDALETGQALRRAKDVLKAERERTLLSEKIPSIWKKMVEEADEELVDAVVKRVYAEISLRPAREQVVAVLRGKPVAAASAPKPAAPETPRATPNRSPRPTAILLFGERHEVRSHRDGLVRVLEVLYERDPSRFPSLLELRGRKRAYLSRDRSGVSRGAPVGSSGYWVDINLSAADMAKRARFILRHLGYSNSDFEFVDD